MRSFLSSSVTLIWLGGRLSHEFALGDQEAVLFDVQQVMEHAGQRAGGHAGGGFFGYAIARGEHAGGGVNPGITGVRCEDVIADHVKLLANRVFWRPDRA